MFVLALLVGALPAAGEGQVSPQVLDQFVYLPLIRMSGLGGLIQHAGAPAAGVQVELRYFNGSTWSTRAMATTNSNGRYLFSVPSLTAGERYYVRYTNTSDSNRLGYWGTKDLMTYDASLGASVATFDIADVVLASPPNEADGYLPMSFTWIMRSASTNDSYEFNLWDPIDDVVYYTYPPLGHVDSYTLYDAPYVDQWYGWWIGIYGHCSGLTGDLVESRHDEKSGEHTQQAGAGRVLA